MSEENDEQVEDVIDETVETNTDITREEMARKMGWRPKEEFRGNPDTWEDHETFLKKAEEEYPRTRAGKDRLEAEVKKMSRTIEAMSKHQERVIAETERRTREQVLAELNQKHLTAVAEGDVNEAHRIMQERDKVITEQRPQQNPHDQRLLEDWAAENTWYNEDPLMADAAAKYENMLAQRGVPLSERLKQTTEYVKRKFPQEFEQAPVRKPATAPQAVVGSRNGVVHSTKPKAGSYEALTRDAKKQCDAFVEGMKKDGKSEQTARETYLSYATADMFQA